MYTMQPLPDYSDVHVGFYILSAICILVFAVVLAFWKEDEIKNSSMLIWAAVLGTFLYYAHCQSYTPKHPLNEKHIGEFVGFNAEGYRERSGKQMVDRHYTYVVYRIDGYDVMFSAETGVAYPPRAVFYKN